MRTLFVIPARGNSKGLPGKNIKKLGDRPLIAYTLQYARLFAGDKDVCITTDSGLIGEIVSAFGYTLPFNRPAELATDTAGMYGVLQHALDVYEKRNGKYDAIVLLQPTSPFRKKTFLEEAMLLFKTGAELVVSVKEAKANPYFNLFEENIQGMLQVSKPGNFARRQDAPAVYQYTGSIYIISVEAFKRYSSLAQFERIIKYVTPENYSVDIDVELDWCVAEFLLKNHLVTVDGKY